MENIITGTKDNLETLIASAGSKTTIVDFWAKWCGPCKILGPILDKIAEENSNIQVIKVDVDENSELSAKYEIRSIPTVFIYKDGLKVDSFFGMKKKDEILKLI